MSAYICGRCHITALAAYAANSMFQRRGIVEIARTLYAANVRSVEARYPGRPATDGRPFKPCEHAMRATYTPVEILKAAQCFEYQACEHDDWPASQAAEIINAVKDQAIASLPGYEQAEWGIVCKH